LILLVLFASGPMLRAANVDIDSIDALKKAIDAAKPSPAPEISSMGRSVLLTADSYIQPRMLARMHSCAAQPAENISVRIIGMPAV